MRHRGEVVGVKHYNAFHKRHSLDTTLVIWTLMHFILGLTHMSGHQSYILCTASLSFIDLISDMLASCDFGLGVVSGHNGRPTCLVSVSLTISGDQV